MAKYTSVTDIKNILEDYSNDIQDGITKSAEQVAEEGKNKLKATTNTYQIRTGKYNKGWKVSEKKGKGFVHTTIHNSTNWQLTHLLEKEHLKRDGKNYTKAFVHIEPVEKECISEFQKDVEHVIKNGG